MPYGISNKQSDCSGWATVEQQADGSLVTVGCHETKQDAIDQMVAISISEDMEPAGDLGERAVNGVKKGDFVSWNSSGGRARGRIERVVTEGELDVPETDFTISATPDDPAALIRIYSKGADGWQPTEVLVGHKLSTLSKISDLARYLLEMPEMPEEGDDIEEEDDDEEEAPLPAFKVLSMLEPEDGLNLRQTLMYQFYEEVADKFGKWDKTAGPDGSHYVEQSPFAAEGMICSNCSFYEGGQRCEIVDGQIAPGAICKLWVIPANLMETGEKMARNVEERAISLAAPAYMRASARRGLSLLEQGYHKVSEGGLKQQTVNDARKMAAGQVSEEKWRKIGPWIARHIVDLDAVQGDEITAGLVAMLLWGGGSTKASARRAQSYAQSIVEKLDKDK